MTKRYSETEFKISENLTVKCWSENTRYGFRHLARLYNNYSEIARAKECYYNRTWERFQFDTVLNKLGNDKVNEFVKNRVSDRGTDNLNFIAAIANLGNLFYEDKKEKNDFKARILKAGIKEIDFPPDWNNLTEEEKEKRLNNSINTLKTKEVTK